jgi:TPR repeat protein
VPINDFAIANKGVLEKGPDLYYPCCGKSICKGCLYSFCGTGNTGKCPFCNSDRASKTEGELEIRRRVEANDPVAMWVLAIQYHKGIDGVQQDHTKAMELLIKSADLGLSKAHCHLADMYFKGGDLNKAKFHYEAAAMAGHEVARSNLGNLEAKSGNMERAIKHWTIGASTGCYRAMDNLRTAFEHGSISRESIDSTLAAYNSSCAEMRSEPI